MRLFFDVLNIFIYFFACFLENKEKRLFLSDINFIKLTHLSNEGLFDGKRTVDLY